MTSIHDVAAYITQRGNLSTMKLQKLCYYAQGWHLAWHGRPLFDEDLEAWRMGPVSRDLYRKHKGQASVDSWEHGSASDVPPEGVATLESILDFYAPYSGFDLGEMTHQERPWQEAWEAVEPMWRGSVTIDKDTIREYFSQRSKASRS